MPDPVVHFEIIGKDPDRLREFYGALFGWRFDTSNPVTDLVSEPTAYGQVASVGTEAPAGGIGGGAAYRPHTIFYVGVADVAAALERAERLGGTRVIGPARRPDGKLVIAHFTDPEGNLVGLAGPG